MSRLKDLCVLGAGNVGRTLARLWLKRAVFTTTGVVNRSVASGQEAARAIGAGVAAGDVDDLPLADVYMISSHDDEIEGLARRLADSRDLTDRIVFHCSGSLSSEALAPARSAGAWVASVHPVRTFTGESVQWPSLEGTLCGCEGDEAALEVLGPAFEAVGGELFRIAGDAKSIYHAAIVFGLNHVVTLLEVSLASFEQAGVSRGLAARLLEPLTLTGVQRAFARGPAAAFSGPLARGDAHVVQRQLETLRTHNVQRAELYALLGLEALNMVEATGALPPARLAPLRSVLEGCGEPVQGRLSSEPYARE